MKNFPFCRLTGLGLLLGLSQVALAQTGGVGIGTSTPAASALLDLTSSTKGLLVPRMTTSQRTAIASPASGLLVYQTDGADAGFWYYGGSAWTFLNPTPPAGLSSVAVTAPLAGSGTTSSPLSIRTASSSQSGALSASDFATFNSKFTLPALTSGSVVFSNGSTLAQDNANLFYDNTKNALGVGTAAPAYSLHVAHGVGTPVLGTYSNGLAISNTGNTASTVWVMYANSGDNGLAFYRNGVKEVEFTPDGSLNSVSDSTKKMHIQPVGPGQLRNIMRLQPKTYHYKATPECQLQYGFMAQELVQVYPEMVRHGRDDDGREYWTVNYMKLIPVLVRGLQEQQATLEEQRAALQAYQQQLAALELAVQRLERGAGQFTAKK